MSIRNPVIWSEGTFLLPNHFQQQARYHDYVARRRGDALCAYQFGLESLEINQENLLHGRFSLVAARGIFPDRTVFDMPGEGPLPPPLDIAQLNVVGEVVYLALPLWASGVPEVFSRGGVEAAARLRAELQETRDAAGGDAEPRPIEIGQLRTRFMLEREDRSAFACIAVARIQEKRSDGSIVLDRNFLPTAYSIEAASRLCRVLDDLSGLLEQRARQIAARLGALKQGGVADVADFMLLHTTNRIGPVFRHLCSIKRVHPERLYETFAAAAGELATFTHESRLPESSPPYDHEQPNRCFDPVIASLRRSLGTMLEPNAIALPLRKHKYGITTASLNDRSLVETCAFVLAVQAAVPMERLAKTFPLQVKISSIDKIRELINLHLPGIVLQPMPTAPRQLPYHAGFTYFMLDHNSPGWEHLRTSSGFAFHIAGDFPELEMQFWAIRGRKD